MQLQAYKGYFEQGNFYSSGKIICIPDRQRVTMIFEEQAPFPYSAVDTSSQQQTVLDVLASLESINEEDFTPEDLESFERLERGDFKLKFEERLP